MSVALAPATVAREVAEGDALYLAAAARMFPSHRQGRPVNASTLFRWVTRGIRLETGETLRLEATRLCGRWLTSKAAVVRFLEAQTPELAAAPSITTPSKRDRDHAAASATLKNRYGI